MFENETYKVFILLDEKQEIIAINSSAFLEDPTGWIEVGSGFGDKFLHAQGNYLGAGLTDLAGRYNYKFINNEIVEIPEEEKTEIEGEPESSAEDRIAQLEEALNLLLEGATE